MNLFLGGGPVGVRMVVHGVTPSKVTLEIRDGLGWELRVVVDFCQFQRDSLCSLTLARRGCASHSTFLGSQAVLAFLSRAWRTYLGSDSQDDPKE